MARANMTVGTRVRANMKPSMAPEPPLPRKLVVATWRASPFWVTPETSLPKPPLTVVKSNTPHQWEEAQRPEKKMMAKIRER